MYEPRSKRFILKVLAVVVPVLLGAVIMSLPSQWFDHGLAPTLATRQAQPSAAPENAGEPQPVSGDTLNVAIREAKPAPGTDLVEFFGNYRLERDQARSREEESLQQLSQEPSADPGVRLEAQKKLLALINATEKERQIEGLLAAEGFAGSLAYTSGDNLTVVVAGRALDPVLATKVGELASRTAGIPPQNVILLEK